LDEVDIALIRVDLLEIIAMAANVAEVHIEDLFPRAEVTDHVVNLLARILEHFGNSALAKIEAVIRAFFDGDKFLQPFRSAEYGVDALKTFHRRHAGIVRVASHSDLVFVGHWNDPLEKIGDALPVNIGRDVAGSSLGRELPRGLGLFQSPCAVSAAAA